MIQLEQDDRVDEIDIEESEQFHETIEPEIEDDVRDEVRELLENEIEQSARMPLRH